MKSKQQVSIEMRVSSHLKDPLQVRFRFMSRWNDLEACKPMKVRTYDVSRAALCVETEIDMRGGSLEFMETEGEEKLKVLPYIFSSERKMGLELYLPPGIKDIWRQWESDLAGTESRGVDIQIENGFALSRYAKGDLRQIG